MLREEAVSSVGDGRGGNTVPRSGQKANAHSSPSSSSRSSSSSTSESRPTRDTSIDIEEEEENVRPQAQPSRPMTAAAATTATAPPTTAAAPQPAKKGFNVKIPLFSSASSGPAKAVMPFTKSRQATGGAGAENAAYRNDEEEDNDAAAAAADGGGGGGENNGKKQKKAKGGKKQRRLGMPNPAARVGATLASAQQIVEGLGDTRRIVIYGYFVIALVHLLFVILACTLSQLDEVGGGCYTYWGYKSNCDTVSYTVRTALLDNCTAFKPYLQAGAAFSILSVLTSTFVMCMAWTLCCEMRSAMRTARRKARYTDMDALGNQSIEEGDGNRQRLASYGAFDPGWLKKMTTVSTVVSLVLELICWALIAGLYSKRPCSPWSLTYGVGFGLAMVAWLIELIAMICFVVLV